MGRCVIGELFTDGRQLFDLSQLLEFRGKHSEYTPETLLKKVDKPIRVHHCTCFLTSIHFSLLHVQRMIRHMIQRDPEERFTAEEYLKVYKGT